jgi:membrane-bound ClpP family serine protease
MAESKPLVSPAASPAPLEAEVIGDHGPAVTAACALILVLAIATIDRITSYDLQLAVFYLVPIAMVTWTFGRNWGLGLSAVIMSLWLVMFSSAHSYSTSFYFYWDGVVLLATFAIVTVLLAKLRDALRAHEVSLSALERLDAPVYIVDLQRDVVVFGNRQFRAAFEGRTAEDLAQRAAREARFHLADGTPAVLRILL